MDLNEFQKLASQTRQIAKIKDPDLLIPLLGLAGEAGSVVSEFKKLFREGNSYQLFTEELKEELGDVLWYLSEIASQNGLALDDIARANVEKNRDEWQTDLAKGQNTLFRTAFFDDGFPVHEQLPRSGRFEFLESGNSANPRVTVVLDGTQPLGARLTDNSEYKDGYRYHDAFHLAYMTILNWSPAIRASLNRKRKESDDVDENQDGGRALVIEEAVSALVFDYAGGHTYFDGVDSVDFSLLRTIERLVRPFEVRKCSRAEWQKAIIEGYKIWRPLVENKGGIIVCDAFKQTLEFERRSDNASHGQPTTSIVDSRPVARVVPRRQDQGGGPLQRIEGV